VRTRHARRAGAVSVPVVLIHFRPRSVQATILEGEY
jgi:hypothetical protein